MNNFIQEIKYEYRVMYRTCKRRPDGSKVLPWSIWQELLTNNGYNKQYTNRSAMKGLISRHKRYNYSQDTIYEYKIQRKPIIEDWIDTGDFFTNAD